MHRKITKRAVDELQAGPTDAFAWDAEIKGFGVRCRPSGAKFYFIKTRIGGRQRWVTIGRHGSPWTPDMARNEALRLLGLKAGGADPATARDRQKGALTVAELGARFLTDYVPKRCKPRTAEEYRRAVELNIKPALGSTRIADVSRADVAAFHHDLREVPYQANRALAVLSKMFSLAEVWGLRPDGSNPCRRVEKYKEEKRERYLSPDEFQRFGTVLAEAQEANTETPFVIAAISLLARTGARLSEILTLQWSHVDLENGVLRLPTSKTGPKVVHLDRATVEILGGLPHMANNRFVIAGDKAGAHLVNLQKAWRRLRAKAGLSDVRIHDLRHSFASVAAGAGMSLPMIGKLLGHSQPATTARYAHLAADPVRQASEEVGSEIAALMQTKKRWTM